VITTTRPVPGRESELAKVAETVLAGVAKTGVRLLVVGTTASLKVPGGGTVVDDPELPDDIRAIALACNEQLAICRANSTVDWVYLSPPALLEPGERTGEYRVGADDLLIDADGRSMISMEDFAVALLDEAERPKHHRTRFTVGY
jgi:uncharacterized protein